MRKTVSGKKTETVGACEQTPLPPTFSAYPVPEILPSLQAMPLPTTVSELLPHPSLDTGSPVREASATYAEVPFMEAPFVEAPFLDALTTLMDPNRNPDRNADKNSDWPAFVTPAQQFDILETLPITSATNSAPDSSPAPRYNVTIQEMPTTERPRERLLSAGASALSTTELLAIQLRTGSTERSALGLAELLLSHFQGLRGLSNASVEELGQVKGIGPVKAVELMATVELGKRLAAMTPEEKPCIRSPQDVANLLMPELRDLKKEHLKSLLLDSKNRVMRIVTVSIGILDSSLVHPREVFKDAILASAAAIIIAHNHPSGDPTPSPEDKRITQRLYEAGQLLGIDLLDHIVIGDQRWISLKERGAF